MERIQVLVDHPDSRRVLVEQLAVHYQIVGSSDLPDGDAGLCIIDCAALRRAHAWLSAYRQEQRPALWPIVLYASRAEVRRLSTEQLQCIDDLLIAPAELFELRLRIRSLLQMRALSLDLERGRAESLSQMVAGVTDCAIFLLDRARRVQSWNAGLEHIAGYGAAEIVGQPVACLYTAEEQQSNLDVQQCARAEAEGYTEDTGWRVRKDGSLFWAEDTTVVLRGPDACPQGFLKLMRDLTEQRRLDVQMLQAQKMETLGRLAGGVAHDFNNLLTALTGYAELAYDALPETHPVRDDLGEILRITGRAARLTSQLLTFGRRQTLSARVLDLNELIAEIDSLLRRLLPANIDFVTSLCADLALIKADSGQIEQVLINLVLNARDAMPDGGQLTIELGNIDSSDGMVGMAPGAYVVLAVSDTGMGISDSIKQHIFEPFFTTKSEGRGTGLGLATCYGIIQQHGGTISIESALDQGTTVRVYLPTATQAVFEAEPAASAEQIGGSETVLLAEDEPSVRAACARLLRAHGYTVLEANDGAEALHLAQSAFAPLIDLLLADVMIPHANGAALVDQMIALHPDIAVLFMSGYNSSAIPQDLLDSGAQFLQKPFSAEGLLRGVRATLDARTPQEHARAYGA